VNRLFQKAALFQWGIRETLRLGRPDISLGFLGGLGDDLLCSCPVAEWLRRGAKRVWLFTRHPALHAHHDARVRLIPEDGRYLALARRLGRPMRALSYATYDEETDRDTACLEHIIVGMCRRAGLTGTIQLRPTVILDDAEIQAAAPFEGVIAVQSGGMAASVPMQNKQWPPERMQRVVDHLKSKYPIVQIGSSADQLLRSTTDMRGKMTLRQTAALLAKARLFVGLVGFPMHLARAVDCPAVIVYGGREPPSMTGYSANRNIVDTPFCAPCWQRNRCDYGRACLSAISAETVIDAAEMGLARPRGPMLADSATL
jgi:hypothetical protein